MLNVQSPPGYLNIFEILIKMGIKPIAFANSIIEEMYFDKETEEHISNYTIDDVTDLEKMKSALEVKRYPLSINLAVIILSIQEKTQHQSAKIRGYVKEYFNEDSLLIDIRRFTVMHRFRTLLSRKLLKAYILHNYAYHELPAEYWVYDNNWYRLLIDGCTKGDIPIAGNSFGTIYFKNEEVDRALAINIKEVFSHPYNNQSFINLNAYSTPWLQVLDAVYNKYGKDELAGVAKASIETFIGEYIKQHALDISSSDIPYLAKFIRLAEQKEGKKYHAKRKQNSK